MPSRSTSRNVAVLSPAATARSPATIGTALAGPTIWSSSCAVTICALVPETPSGGAGSRIANPDGVGRSTASPARARSSSSTWPRSALLALR